jgi:hypothetical protein
VGDGYAGQKGAFGDRHMWRLLLARLHPDAGGDHELFLFACALKDEVCRERLFGHDGPAMDHPFSTWRSTMSSWASGNRDALRKPRSRRAARGGRSAL